MALVDEVLRSPKCLVVELERSLTVLGVGHHAASTQKRHALLLSNPY